MPGQTKETWKTLLTNWKNSVLRRGHGQFTKQRSPEFRSATLHYTEYVKSVYMCARQIPFIDVTLDMLRAEAFNDSVSQQCFKSMRDVTIVKVTLAGWKTHPTFALK